jgi:hypothetical protein
MMETDIFQSIFNPIVKRSLMTDEGISPFPGVGRPTSIACLRKISVNEVVIERSSCPAAFHESCDCLWIPFSIEIISQSFMRNCESINFVVFENDSKMRQLEALAFSGSGLKSIFIPASVEVISHYCFYGCKSFESITFENKSKMRRLGSSAFSSSALKSIRR